MKLTAAEVGKYRAAPELKVKVNVNVVVHLMEAYLGEEFDKTRRDEATYRKLRHLVAPDPGAVGKYWTSKVFHDFLDWNGMVNQIWEQASIQLFLVRVESCTYGDPIWNASSLRLDEPRRSQRDSIFIPETTIPWSTRLFRSINRLFTAPEPDVLHVLIWWSVDEGEGDNAPGYLGYARAAGRGGPTVWLSTRFCLQFDKPPKDDRDSERRYAECARLVAHEIGHALGLHHVQKGMDDDKKSIGDVKDPDNNLMEKGYPGVDLEGWQKQKAQEEARRRFNPQ